MDAQVVLRIQEDRKREAALQSRIDLMEFKKHDNKIGINKSSNHVNEVQKQVSPVNTSLVIEIEVYIFIYMYV